MRAEKKIRKKVSYFHLFFFINTNKEEKKGVGTEKRTLERRVSHGSFWNN